LVGIGRAERIGHDPQDAVAAVDEQDHPDATDHQAAPRRRQELQGGGVDDGPGEPARLEVPGQLA
jgi:hypothetical protein